MSSDYESTDERDMPHVRCTQADAELAAEVCDFCVELAQECLAAHLQSPGKNTRKNQAIEQLYRSEIVKAQQVAMKMKLAAGLIFSKSAGTAVVNSGGVLLPNYTEGTES